jgi:hypothetical protein
MVDVAAFRQAVMNHLAIGVDPNADIKANQDIVAKEANDVAIPSHLRMVANDIAIGNDGAKIAEIAGVLKAVAMHAPTGEEHDQQDPMKLATLPTPPNGPDKSQVVALA